MWDDHPEWREKTATGTDGKVGWRYLMNFQDPDCFQAAMDWTKVLLNSSDWDGVDIAELNFDADFKDYLRPDKFVPMNDIVRADFKKKAGFDPIQLFRPNSPHYYKTDPAGLAKFRALPRRHCGGLAPARAVRTGTLVQAARDGSDRYHAR